MKPVVNASGPSVPAEPRMLGAWDLFIGVSLIFCRCVRGAAGAADPQPCRGLHGVVGRCWARPACRVCSCLGTFKAELRIVALFRP